MTESTDRYVCITLHKRDDQATPHSTIGVLLHGSTPLLHGANTAICAHFQRPLDTRPSETSVTTMPRCYVTPWRRVNEASRSLDIGPTPPCWMNQYLFVVCSLRILLHISVNDCSHFRRNNQASCRSRFTKCKYYLSLAPTLI
jgi:hypothetical protein